MLDPIINFFTRIFHLMGRGVGLAVAWLLWPFLAAGRWYTKRGWIVRGAVGGVVLLFVGLYAYFFWQTQVWYGFDPDYVKRYNLTERNVSAGEQVSAASGTDTSRTCGRSAIVDASFASPSSTTS